MQNGAIGAKLTGAGVGGNIIELVKEEKYADKILNFFYKNGFSGFISKIKSNRCK